MPNFTLISDSKKGRRPTFFAAARPAAAQALFEEFVKSLKFITAKVQIGIFGADMTIETTVRGPVNLVIEDDDLV